MHLACKSGNIDLVKYIISLNKIDIKSKNIFLCLLLCVMFQTFLCFLFNFNSFDIYGILKSIWSYNTILHLACESGNIDIVKYIVSFNEIDITTKNVFYSFVCFWCFHKNIHYIPKSASILWNLKSKFIFKTPVDIANDFSHEKIVQILENELERWILTLITFLY